MEWAVHNVPASRRCNYPLFRYGPVGGRGATIRRLMDVFLLEPVSRHFTYTPVRTKSLDSCMGYRLLLRTRHPFHMHSLYRSDCLSISAHVCTEMHMNICVYVCVYLCVHIYISPCMYVYVLQAFLSFYSSL